MPDAVPTTRRPRGQATVEFALSIGIMLVIFLAVVDFGRMIAMHTAAVTASREAARYGSAIGDNGSGVERYRDCAGIRQAARAVTGALITLPDDAIVVAYDRGPDTTPHATCVVGTPPAASAITSLDRVSVQVTFTYEPISLVRLIVGPTTVDSTDRRTIVKP